MQDQSWLEFVRTGLYILAAGLLALIGIAWNSRVSQDELEATKTNIYKRLEETEKLWYSRFDEGHRQNAEAIKNAITALVEIDKQNDELRSEILENKILDLDRLLKNKFDELLRRLEDGRNELNRRLNDLNNLVTKSRGRSSE